MASLVGSRDNLADNSAFLFMIPLPPCPCRRPRPTPTCTCPLLRKLNTRTTKSDAVPAGESDRPGAVGLCRRQVGQGVEGQGLPAGRAADLERLRIKPNPVH